MNKKLGTILPTKKSINDTNKYHLKNNKIKEEIEQTIKNCTIKMINSEKRFYKNDNLSQFAIVGLIDHKIKWFEHRGNDIYAIKK